MEIGYKITIQELCSIDENVFCNELQSLLKNQINENQKFAWKRTREFLSKQFDDLDDEKKKVSMLFECELADKTRPDVMIISNNKVIILEFKTGNSERKINELKANIDQTENYYDMVVKYMEPIWRRINDKNIDFSVERYLVYSDIDITTLPLEIQKYSYILDEKGFGAVTRLIGTPDAKLILELEKTNSESSPDTIDMLCSVLCEDQIPEMFTNMEAVNECASIVNNIIEKEEPALNVIFVNGAPGTGKTALGFTLLREGIKKKLKTHYFTGNGNLGRIFKDIIKKRAQGNVSEENIKLFEEICPRRKIVELYKNNNYKNINSNVLIFDEAQRAWDYDMVALNGLDGIIKDNCRNKGKCQYCNYKCSEPACIKGKAYFEFVRTKQFSEPALLLLTLWCNVTRSKRSQVLICLLGNGQEIYKGESGLSEWVRVIEKINRNIKVYAAGEVANNFKKITVQIENKLKLVNNQRGFGVNEYLEVVENLLLCNTEKCRNLIQKSQSLKKFSIHFVNSKDEAINYFSGRSSELSYGIITNSFENDEPSQSFKNKYVKLGEEIIYPLEKKNNARGRFTEWFVDGKSKELKNYATEFDCQGLELDIPLFIWGNKMLYRNGKWVIDLKKNALTSYFRKLKSLSVNYTNSEELEKEMVKNIYRVLLTRGRRGILFHVRDKETCNYLKEIFCKEEKTLE